MINFIFFLCALSFFRTLFLFVSFVRLLTHWSTLTSTFRIVFHIVSFQWKCEYKKKTKINKKNTITSLLFCVAAIVFCANTVVCVYCVCELCCCAVLLLINQVSVLCAVCTIYRHLTIEISARSVNTLFSLFLKALIAKLAVEIYNDWVQFFYFSFSLSHSHFLSADIRTFTKFHRNNLDICVIAFFPSAKKYTWCSSDSSMFISKKRGKKTKNKYV